MNRHITLMLNNGTLEELNKIKEFCRERNIEFSYRYSRTNSNREYEDADNIAELYYFTIFSDTKNYTDLQELIGEHLMTTDLADICNIADLDDSFEEGLRSVLQSLKEAQNAQLRANKNLLDFIMPIKDSATLHALEAFTVYMSDFQKKIIRDRIDICEGNKEIIEEEMTHSILSLHNDVRKLRAMTGMNRKQFSEYFGIPYRTVEDWENKKSTCAKYLFDLMENCLRIDGKIK